MAALLACQVQKKGVDPPNPSAKPGTTWLWFLLRFFPAPQQPEHHVAGCPPKQTVLSPCIFWQPDGGAVAEVKFKVSAGVTCSAPTQSDTAQSKNSGAQPSPTGTPGARCSSGSASPEETGEVAPQKYHTPLQSSS